MTLSARTLSLIDSLNNMIFKPCNYGLTQLQPEPESRDYAAHRFEVNDKQIIFRVAKITPNKTGQFVTIWKRNLEKITAPFDVDDQFDLLMIVTQTPSQTGVFIFPKAILRRQQIISDSEKAGKRGIRVYPPWEQPASRQSQKTQGWQTEFFLDFSDSTTIDMNRAKKLLSLSS